MRIGWIGLGAIGRPMAARLATTFDVRVWNRTAEVAHDHAATHGTTAVDDLLDLAEVDLVCSCLPTDVEVAAVARVLGPALDAGTRWLDHTSGAPAGARDVAAELSGHDVHYLDAPVSGGVAGAEAGTLTVMVGGDAEDLAVLGPVLEVVAARVVHTGPTGAGMAVKAANQVMLAANLWAAAEALAAVRAAGVPTATALEVLGASTGRSFAAELIADRVVDRSFPFTFALDLLAKDVRLAAALVADQGTPGEVVRLVAALTDRAADHLGPDADHVELVKLVEAAAGRELT